MRCPGADGGEVSIPTCPILKGKAAEAFYKKYILDTKPSPEKTKRIQDAIERHTKMVVIR